MVPGGPKIVDHLITHEDVKAVSFVGSTKVAQHIYTTATAAGKRAQALGGAKNYMVIMPDANLDMAADAAVSAAYGSAGERCMAVSMVVAVGGIADELVAAIEGADPESQGRRWAPPRIPRWARSSLVSIATRSRGTSSAPPARVRRSSSTAARVRRRAAASSSARR